MVYGNSKRLFSIDEDYNDLLFRFFFYLLIGVEVMKKIMHEQLVSIYSYTPNIVNFVFISLSSYFTLCRTRTKYQMKPLHWLKLTSFE